jgi:O-antigen ligase
MIPLITVLGLGVAALGIAFALGARRLALAVLLLRPSCDRIFDLIKSTLGTGLGPGAALNALVICLAFLFVIESPGVFLAAIGPWVGFLMTAFASIIGSPEPTTVLRECLDLTTYAAVFALPFGLVRSSEWALRCLFAALWSSVIPIAYTFVELAAGSAATEAGIRVSSTFTHPNIFAFYLVTLMGLILFMLSSVRISVSPLVRRSLVLYVPITGVLILLTGTRSAWICAALLLVIFCGLLDRRYLIAVLLVPFVVYIPGIEERISDLGSGNVAVQYQALNSYAWRQTIWQNTWDWMMAHPALLFGNGLDSYSDYAPRFFVGAEPGEHIGPHNVFLQIFFELGLLGLVTYLFLFAVVFYKLIRGSIIDKPGSIMIIALVVSDLIFCYSDNMLDYVVIEWNFWFIVGTVCAWNRLSSLPRVVVSLPSVASRCPSDLTAAQLPRPAACRRPR